MLTQTAELSKQGVRELNVEHMRKMKRLQGLVTVEDSTEILMKIINTESNEEFVEMMEDTLRRNIDTEELAD